MPNNRPITTIEDYEPLVGAESVAKIRGKAKALKDLHVVNVNSTYYGGGVAELLTSVTLLMNSMGLKTGWRVMQGAADFFSITKKMHNALQGGSINLSKRKIQIYEEITYENAVRNHLDNHNMVIIHDPQPLLMIQHYKKMAHGSGGATSISQIPIENCGITLPPLSKGTMPSS
jgi:trehalose synthase